MAPDAVFEFIIACSCGKQGGHEALYRKPASGRPIDDPLAYLELVKGHGWTLSAKSRQSLLADYPKKSPAEAGPENRVSQLGARVVGWRDGQNEARGGLGNKGVANSIRVLLICTRRIACLRALSARNVHSCAKEPRSDPGLFSFSKAPNRWAAGADRKSPAEAGLVQFARIGQRLRSRGRHLASGSSFHLRLS